MSGEHRPCRSCPAGQRLPPGIADLGQLDPLEYPVGEVVEQRLLAWDVMVERHRLNAEHLRDTAHAHGGDTCAVGDGGGRGNDPLPAQWCAPRHFPILAHLRL